MTIARLLPPADDSPRSAEGDRALVFVLNSQFLDQFGVLCASLVATRSFLRHPVVVISDEAAVHDAPIVRQIADQVIQVGVNDTDYVKDVDTRRVPEKYRYKHLPKYTFTKWLIFKLGQYRELIYLDCDMVCLTKLDDKPFFAAPMGNADMFGCPVFPAETYNVYKQGDANYAAYFEEFLSKDLSDGMSRLNSGVMRLGPKLLTGAFFRDLLAFASSKPCKNEQSYLTEFFRQAPDYNLAFWPPWYNMHASNFGRLGIGTQLNWLSQVAILHYIGDRKPSLNTDATSSLPDFLWHQFAQTSLDGARNDG